MSPRPGDKWHPRMSARWDRNRATIAVRSAATDLRLVRPFHRERTATPMQVPRLPPPSDPGPHQTAILSRSGSAPGRGPTRRSVFGADQEERGRRCRRRMATGEPSRVRCSPGPNGSRSAGHQERRHGVAALLTLGAVHRGNRPPYPQYCPVDHPPPGGRGQAARTVANRSGSKCVIVCMSRSR